MFSSPHLWYGISFFALLCRRCPFRRFSISLPPLRSPPQGHLIMAGFPLPSPPLHGIYYRGKSSACSSLVDPRGTVCAYITSGAFCSHFLAQYILVYVIPPFSVLIPIYILHQVCTNNTCFVWVSDAVIVVFGSVSFCLYMYILLQQYYTKYYTSNNCFKGPVSQP